MKTAVTAKLDSLDIKYTIKPHAKPVFTSEDAARERGVRLSQIVKTMLLLEKSGKIIVAVLPGDRRLDMKKIKKLAGVKDLRFMNKESVEKKLGLVAGAIAPIAELFAGSTVFVDPAVFDEKWVDISSGDTCAGLEYDLVTVTSRIYAAGFRNPWEILFKLHRSFHTPNCLVMIDSRTIQDGMIL